MNAITHEAITVINDSYINAIGVCELLQKLATLKLAIPITLVLDNALTEFQTAISNCIENAHITHKQELKSLLTLRFQNLKKAQIIPV